MARSRNSLLGQGGQRKKLNRAEMRGGAGSGTGADDDAVRRKEELLKKIREKSGQPETAEPEKEKEAPEKA